MLTCTLANEILLSVFTARELELGPNAIDEKARKEEIAYLVLDQELDTLNGSGGCFLGDC